MTAQASTGLRGVRSVEDVRLRCHCADVTGCWNWRGAYTQSRESGKVAAPCTWFPQEERIVTTMRAVWVLTRGAAPPLVWRECMNTECVNPKHLLGGTRAQWGAWQKKIGHLRGDPRRAATCFRVALACGRTRVTPEIAAWVRESEQTGVEVAHAIGETPKVVSRIRRRHTFSPKVGASSVWAWAGSASMGAKA